jgi:DegV family protein with EDD domain
MIRILTDDTAGFTFEDERKYGIEIVRVAVTSFDEWEWFDKLTDSSVQEFYDKLADGEVFAKTGHTRRNFEEVFSKGQENDDEIIYFSLSNKLGGAISCARQVKEMLGYEKLHIIDTLSVLAGHAMQVLEAVRLRNEGKMTAKEIAEEMTRLAQKARCFMYLSTVKYLYKGGRTYGVTNIASGGILNLKAIVECKLEDGLCVIGRRSGTSSSINHIVDKLGQLGFDKKRAVYFSHSVAPEKCDMAVELAMKKYNIKHGGNFFIPAVLGAHLGPRAVAVGFYVR